MKITRQLPSLLKTIPLGRQRRLVILLFTWEEECTRWRLLDEEEAEIRQHLDMADPEMRKVLEISLKAIQMKRKMLPSRRGSTHEALPEYEHPPSFARSQIRVHSI